MPYGLKHLYHSTIWVPDLDQAAGYFDEVFGRESFVLGEYLGSKRSDLPRGHRNDYALFTPVAEVQLECVDPTLMLIDGVQVHRSVPGPKLGALAWFVDGIVELWSEMRRQGFGGFDQRVRSPAGEGPPLDVSSTPIIFTRPEETGLSYELCVYLPRRDPRGDPPRPALSDSDPLGIEACSHHTVLTGVPERASRFLVDILAGQVFHRERNVVLGTESTFIALADAVVELAQPLEGSPMAEACRRSAPLDSYYSITWKVGDLDRVAKHLEAKAVPINIHGETLIATDPSHGLGIPWGFSTMFNQNDPRQSQPARSSG